VRSTSLFLQQAMEKRGFKGEKGRTQSPLFPFDIAVKLNINYK